MKSNKTERLRALKEYKILDTENEKVFDEMTKLLSQICETQSGRHDERTSLFK